MAYISQYQYYENAGQNPENDNWVHTNMFPCLISSIILC
jgi:hypothetical protein